MLKRKMKFKEVVKKIRESVISNLGVITISYLGPCSLQRVGFPQNDRYSFEKNRGRANFQLYDGFFCVAVMNNRKMVEGSINSQEISVVSYGESLNSKS